MRKFKIKPKTRIGCYGLLAILALLAGCADRTTAPATVRNSSKQPVFASSDDTIEADEIGAGNVSGALKFLNADHFFCLKFDLAALKSSEMLAAVPWNQMNDALGDLAGQQDLSAAVVSTYFLIDSQLLELENPERSMAVLVELEPSTRVDPEKYEAASTRGHSDAEIQAHRLLAPNLIAYGPSEFLSRLNSQQALSPAVADRLRVFSNGKSLSGFLAIRPIRPLLNGVFASLANVPQFKDYAQVPNQIQGITLVVDLQNPQRFIDLRIQISDAELRKTIVQRVNQLVSNEVEIPDTLGQIPGIPGAPDAMFNAESTGVVLAIAQETVNEGLLTASANSDGVSLQLSQPNRLPDLVTALVSDFARQSNLAERMSNAKRLADALKEYHEQHGKLPPVGAVSANSDLPPQTNWRTGLLPYLGFENVYQQLDFDRPVDHPANESVLSQLATEMKLPHQRFQLVRGENRIYRDLEIAPSLADVTARKRNTAIVVEDHNSDGATWAQPPKTLEPLNADEIGVEDEDGIIAITADFKVRVLKKSVRKTADFLTVGGDKKISRRDFLNIEP